MPGADSAPDDQTVSPASPGGTLRPEVWLVRHGETEWSAAGRHTGSTDVPLTDLGRTEAEAIARPLAGTAFRRVRTSPLARAEDTARLAGFPGAEPCDDLREWNYGTYEGRTTADIRAERPGWSLWRDGAPGGETVADVAARVDRVIAEARKLDGPTLLFAHAHVLRVLAARWLDLRGSEGQRFLLDPASISVLGWERETAVIRHWNLSAT